MKRLIKRSSSDINEIVKSVSEWLQYAAYDRENQSSIMNNIINEFPNCISSGTFYRAHIIRGSRKTDFKNKIMTIDNLDERLNEEMPTEILDNIIKICQDDINNDGLYYSFSKNIRGAEAYLYTVGLDSIEGEVYFIFSSNTSGIDIAKFYNEISKRNDIDGDIMNEFESVYEMYAEQEEVACKIEDINIYKFLDLRLNEKNNIDDLLSSLE